MFSTSAHTPADRRAEAALSARLAGNLAMTRFANSTIRSQFKGSVGLSIQFAAPRRAPHRPRFKAPAAISRSRLRPIRPGISLSTRSEMSIYLASSTRAPCLVLVCPGEGIRSTARRARPRTSDRESCRRPGALVVLHSMPINSPSPIKYPRWPCWVRSRPRSSSSGVTRRPSIRSMATSSSIVTTTV